MGGPGYIDGECHYEIDNFLPCKFKENDIEYYSSENYFQCQKATTKEDFEKVRNSGTGMDVWAAGSRIKLRSDWEAIKVRVMYTGNKLKFEQNPDLAKKLCNSKGKITFYGSTSFWCKWNGLIMERIRAELRQNGEEDAKRAKEIEEMMNKYEKEMKEKYKI